jgi:hypothetical protein
MHGKGISGRSVCVDVYVSKADAQTVREARDNYLVAFVVYLTLRVLEGTACVLRGGLKAKEGYHVDVQVG